jgi:hypothetical protein
MLNLHQQMDSPMTELTWEPYKHSSPASGSSNKHLACFTSSICFTFELDNVKLEPFGKIKTSMLAANPSPTWSTQMSRQRADGSTSKMDETNV